jgi:arylsulfatase A-like enzyme
MKRYAAVAALSVVLLPSWLPVQGGIGQTDPAPNILLIVLDDVGKDALQCYAPPVPTAPTPRIAQLAQSGVKFTRCYGNPLCSPTRATIMTGRYPFRTGMGYLSSWLNDGDLEEYALPLSEESIPEALSDGPVMTAPPYTCGAFGKWHLSASNYITHPIDQGFDKFVGSVENTGNHFNWDRIDADATSSCVTHFGQPYAPNCGGVFDETTFSASVVRQAATDWIQSVSEPFFAYVCFNPPHSPWQVPPYSLLSTATLNSFNHAQYPQGEPQQLQVDQAKAYKWLLEAIDTEIGRLVDNIPTGKRSRTTILIVADNGTPGQVIDTSVYDNTHAKGRVYEQGVNVPLIASGYKVNTGGQTCNGLVHTVDLWRTVLALAGLPVQVPSGYVIDGKSFKQMLSNPAAASNRTDALSQLYQPNGPYDPALYPEVCDQFPPALKLVTPSNQRAMTDGHYKYIRRFNELPGTPGQGYQEAYDLLANPLELNTGPFPFVDLWAYWGWPQTADVCDLNGLVNPNDPAQVAVNAVRTAMINLSGS